MAYNTLESVWDVGVSNALGWHFLCWFPSLYILIYLVPQNSGSALAGHYLVQDHLHARHSHLF